MNTQKKPAFCQDLAEGFQPGSLSVAPVLMVCDHINKLPDSCLILVLARLPLIDLLRASVVCRRWKSLRTIVCNKRTNLALFSPFETTYATSTRQNNYRLKTDLLRFFELDYQRFDLITNVNLSYFQHSLNSDKELLRKLLLVRCHTAISELPAALKNIHQLTIFDCALSADQIIKLLNSWKYSLTTLRLVITQTQFDWTKLFEALNELHSLEHLSLFCFEGIVQFSEHLPIQIMSQLKTFYYAEWDYSNSNHYYYTMTQSYLFRAWEHLNPDKLEAFGFGLFSAHTNSAPFVRYNLKRLLKKKPALVNKLTRVRIPHMSRTFIEFLCSNFPSITFLDCELHDLKNDLEPLVRTKQLKCLAIRSNTRPYSNSAFSGITEKQILKLPLLESVQHLFVLDFDIRPEVLRFVFPKANVSKRRRGDDNEVDYLETTIGEQKQPI